MNEKSKFKLNISPPRLIVSIFIILIMLGTALLNLPLASADGTSIGWVDSLFTSASAVCVNGLVVIDTGSSFSTFGEIVIMLLIQVGGLGFMTFGVMIAIILGRRIGLKQRLTIQETTQSRSSQGLIKLCIYIMCIALSFELVATLVLTLRWMNDMGLGQATYYALFHSVSAFNNAGFSLWEHSLSEYYNDPIVNLVIMTLFISGGLGYIVIVEIFKKRRWQKFSLHTKVVLTTSGALIVVGFILIFLLESFNHSTFGSLNLSERITASLFQSTTPRSAGFNTIDIRSMLSSSQFIIIILMFIGASSGGTGGGIKTNTFIVLILATFNAFRGGGDIHIFKRRIVTNTVIRALAVVVSSLVFIFVVTLSLTITEGMLQEHFLEILFEATSAFSTTGLSMGLTDDLSTAGKFIVAITMFIGRLGPLTLAYALTKKKRSSTIGYPKDHILIG